ncbi:hypothetical protein [Rickettsia endosymbiont of Ixodes scapularis]|uniref:hypothetical protein n=1 Tax=Rickettsia endosymbiont of Ixodes scapularis TaxID=444612 RepID=UPI0002D93754|nr:hypothetical protein [Rickettsia endosymbiont of Ixodes scapularis]
MNVKNKDVREEESNNQYLRIIYSLLPVLLIFCVNVILSEVALGETLEGQLDRIGGLSTGKLKTIGISGATILSSIWAVVRGNLRLAGAIVAIGIILGFYLEWVSSGMKIS